MAQQTILGGPGVYWGSEKVKVNANFTELYSREDFTLWDKDYLDLINRPTIPVYTAGTGIAISVGNAISMTWDYDYADLINKPTIPTVSDTEYDSTSWNGNNDAPTKNAVRDKIETMGSGSSGVAHSGTISIPSGTVTSGSCVLYYENVSGVLDTDTLVWSFVGDPTTVSGWLAADSSPLVIYAWSDEGSVQFQICNHDDTNNVTRGAIVLRWSALR